MSLPELDLKKDIACEVNRGTPHVAYDLPYILSSAELEALFSIVESAPYPYKLHIKDNLERMDGMVLVLELLE